MQACENTSSQILIRKMLSVSISYLILRLQFYNRLSSYILFSNFPKGSMTKIFALNHP